jgi:Pup-ligase protein
MIIGLETEYLVYERSGSSTNWHLLERGDLDRLLLTEKLTFSSMLADDDHKLWLANGGMLYVDEPFLEYCTPECLNPVDVDAAARAGDWHLRRLASAHEYFTGTCLEFCMNRGPDGQLAGFHENYAVSERLFDQLFWPTGWPRELALEVLVPQLVTREAVAACAELGLSHRSVAELPLALKFQAINEVAGAITEDSRPILRIKTPVFDEKFFRLELTCGWRWENGFALQTMLGSTALILYGVEHGIFTGRSWKLADPVAAFARACTQPYASLDLADGTEASPLQIQREMWNAVFASSENSWWMRDFDGNEFLEKWYMMIVGSAEWLADQGVPVNLERVGAPVRERRQPPGRARSQD